MITLIIHSYIKYFIFKKKKLYQVLKERSMSKSPFDFAVSFFSLFIIYYSKKGTDQMKNILY